MPKSKNQTAIILPDDANSLSVTFYISDAASVPPNSPRCIVNFVAQHFDHAISEYTTLTPAQKTSLRAMLLAIRDETFTLEGYV